jgi:hypothetical protein
MPPRELTVRVLRIAIAAAVIVPCLLFAYASWVSYRSANTLADERIVRSLDVQQEQAVKAFQLIDNALNDAADLVAGLSDDQIKAEESQLHFEFGKLVRSAPVVQSIWIYDPTGVPLVTSWVEQPPLHSYTDRDFFQAHLRPGTGMYYGKVYASEFNAQAFFTVSRRLEMDGAFAGVLEVSVLPSNFVRFFSTLALYTGTSIRLGRHQVAVRTHEVIFIAEIDVPVVGAFILEPHALGVAAINPCARPRADERVVDGGDVVVQQIRIRFIEIEPLGNDGLVVRVHRRAARVEDTRTPEVAGLDLEHVVVPVAVLVYPAADRVTGIGRIEIAGPVASINVDAARRRTEEVEQNVDPAGA